MTLPQSVLSREEFRPIEDVMLAVFRDAFPDIDVQSQIELHETFPFILVRGHRSPNGWDGDDRFVDWAQIEVQVYTDGLDADEDGARISEAIRVALRDAAKACFRIPGYGYLKSVEMTSRPHNAPDWATATGPVQYADLPSAVTRYETRYTVEVRRQG